MALAPAATAVAQQLVVRQLTLTQTITQAGSTTTALVTLGRGGPTTEAPPPPNRGASDSGGLSPAEVGIIVGCTVGAVVVVFLTCCCLANRYGRFVSDRSSDDESQSMSDISHVSITRRTLRPGWPTFPRSIPPPTVRPGQRPFYRARAEVPPRWTANNAARRATTSYL